MPLPVPKKGESREEFISRAMRWMNETGEFEGQKQRLAVAFSQWRRKD